MPAYAIVSNYAGKVIDHREYPARCRRLSEAELLYTIADARESLAAWPDCPSAGYYQDEIHYAAAELERRRRGGRRDTTHAARMHAALEAEAAALAALLDQ
jgi:hypothetical protein